MMDALVDANGAAITLGATVKLVGTVTGLNGFSLRFNDVQITLSHPLPASSGPPLNQQSNNQVSGGNLNTPGYRTVLSVPPGVLVVGS